MTPIYMIIAVLATTALAEVGQQLIFHLSDKANTTFTLWKEDKHRFLKSSGNVTIDQRHANHSQYINGGTYKLGNAMKTDSGNYTLEEFGSNGMLVKKVHVSLEIKAPVSKPAVSQECLSLEQMQVICSSEGDEAEFILMLDGQVLMQSREHNQSMGHWAVEKSNISTASINLHGQMTGNLTCEVWNKVSNAQTVIYLKDCKDILTSFPVVTVVTANVIVFVLFVALGLVIKFHRTPTLKNNNVSDNVQEEVIYTDVKKTRSTTVDDDTSEDGDKIIYSDVRVIKHTKKPSDLQENTMTVRCIVDVEI
ncbi:uncharacterized protein LOC114446335 isoform X2 [Parambassis ranga]|uniref:Uncharacterized protein LOC114446335 isoform X2 n=1 Tax=Parambassis ranga TaxID=210632 RepID=A0A6P7JQ79_9TELE|nr:uncharacterized protein LOC114446335 isoform X2 [Parambassis ranga]